MTQADQASDMYRLKILPAGRDDRVAEISDREGNVVKYSFAATAWEVMPTDWMPG